MKYIFKIIIGYIKSWKLDNFHNNLNYADKYRNNEHNSNVPKPSSHFEAKGRTIDKIKKINTWKESEAKSSNYMDWRHHWQRKYE